MVAFVRLAPSRYCWTILLGLVCHPLQAGKEGPDIADQVAALKKEFEPQGKALDKVVDKARAAKDEKAAEEGVQAWRKLAADYAKRLFAVVEQNPKHVASGDALLWILEMAPRSPEMRKAVKLLEKEHLQNAYVKSYLLRLYSLLARWPGEFPEIERYLRVVHEKHTDSDTRGLAGYALAMALKYHPNPSLRKEAESLFEICVTKYPDCIVPAYERIGRSKLAQRANEELFEIRRLAVGKVAPDIAGPDLEGKAFKLSDYRGKVVMLSFWGAWCPHARKFAHQQHLLLDRLKNSPFEIIGINSDKNPEAMRSRIDKAEITWRSFSSEGKGLGGPIQKQWNVHHGLEWYLVDHNGVIRLHKHSEPDLEELYKLIQPYVLTAQKARAGK